MFFFAVALLGRGILTIGFIERPLTLGFAWALFTGEAVPALPLAVFFELFWLDLFPIGTFVPPMPAFPFLLLLALARHFSWTTPIVLTFPLALTLPLAYLLPYFELRQRNAQTSAYSLLLAKSRTREPLGSLPGWLVLRSASQQLAGGLVLFLFFLVSALAFFSFEPVKRLGIAPLDVDWPMLYVLAGLGALLALRIQRAYVVFSILTVVLMAYKFS